MAARKMRAAAAVQRAPRDAVRKARNDLYRRHIVEAAEQVFADRGFEAANMQEISERAGLSMGTIYAIFPGKTDLYTAILDERAQEMVHLAKEVAERRAPAAESVAALIESYVGYFVDHPHFLRMHLRQGSSWILMPGSDARLRYWQDIHRIQAQIFRRGIDEGVFVDEDPAFLAKMFSAMDQVLLAHWVEGGMKADRTDLVRRLAAMVERAFGRG